MKDYLFNWTDDIYLIHVQFNVEDMSSLKNKTIVLSRTFADKSVATEERVMTNDSFRFIISKSCPEEAFITISYDSTVTMKLFLIDDRAYYPTEAYYEG